MKIVQSSDNSKTVYSEKYDESYHSLKDGAFNETLTKHIRPAFEIFRERNEINILDICFGLGYNSLLTVDFANRYFPDKKVNIYSPEMDEELLESLSDFAYEGILSEYKNTISEIVNEGKAKKNYCSMNLFRGNAREYIKNFSNFFDVVYQDAFSPKKNEELWTYEYFEDIKNCMKTDGILTTYSKATAVKMALWMNDFFVYEINVESRIKSSLVASMVKRNGIGIELLMANKIKNNPDAKPLFDKK